MEKSYKPTQLYFLKTIGLTVATIAAFVFFYFFYSLFTISLPKVAIVVINILFGIFLLIALLFIVLNILKGKPTLHLTEEYIKIKYKKIPFENIKAYHKAKGGSEPEILTKDNKNYILELSWFTKKDRKEIEAYLISKIT